jgi:hypothetical protein
MANFVFRCRATGVDVQHQSDDDSDISEKRVRGDHLPRLRRAASRQSKDRQGTRPRSADRARYDKSPHGDTDEYDQRPSAKEEAAAALQRAAAAIQRPLPNVPLPKKRPIPRRGCRTDGGHFCSTGARSINSQAPQVLPGRATRPVAVSVHRTAAFFHFGGLRERATRFPRSVQDNRRCRDGPSASS